MSDYIKREDAMRSIIAHDQLKDLGDSRGYAEWLLNKAPSADVAPVRHGRWIEHYKSDAPPTLKERWICSWCGNVQTYGITDYCPNCGAKMDKQIGNAIEAHTEIIRCNECDYWERYCNRETGRCDAHMMTTEEDDFCSWSEKKDK